MFDFDFERSRAEGRVAVSAVDLRPNKKNHPADTTLAYSFSLRLVEQSDRCTGNELLLLVPPQADCPRPILTLDNSTAASSVLVSTGPSNRRLAPFIRPPSF